MSDVTQEDTGGINTLSWPPTSQTVKLMFLYSTVSTLNPVPNEVLVNLTRQLLVEEQDLTFSCQQGYWIYNI